MTGRAASKVGTHENKAVSKTPAKKSCIPLPKSRLPLRDIQPPTAGGMESTTHKSKPKSAVREVPNFKQLHKQWERKLERAKEVKKQSSRSRCQTPLPSINVDKLHTQASAIAAADRLPTLSRGEQVDAIFARLALSTNNTIRKMSMVDQDNCSSVRANLNEQFTEAQVDSNNVAYSELQSVEPVTLEPQTKHLSVEPVPQTKHLTVEPVPQTKHLTVEPVPQTKHLSVDPVMFVYNYYECEPELAELVFTKQVCVHTRSSGRRNPVGVVLATMDSYSPTECLFTTIQ